MFCPKCGTKNPDTGKFCRSCGTDLGNVSKALLGKNGPTDQHLTKNQAAHLRRKDPNELFGDSVKSIISGFGFLFVSFALFVTGVAGGRAWWWAMLFPAFGLLSKGVSDYLKMKRIEKRSGSISSDRIEGLNNSEIGSLPPSKTEYVPPGQGFKYNTGELAPPSVTEQTTRLLDPNADGGESRHPPEDPN